MEVHQRLYVLATRARHLLRSRQVASPSLAFSHVLLAIELLSRQTMQPQRAQGRVRGGRVDPGWTFFVAWWLSGSDTAPPGKIALVLHMAISITKFS